jgi:hypothetical protein
VEHFDGEEITTDPPLFAGTTGEFCFAAPPTAVCFFGPPTAFWAEAGWENANAPRTTSAITRTIVPFFINASSGVVPPTGSWRGVDDY